MNRKILLADDDQRVLAVVEATLGNDGTVEIRQAHDGEEALEIARQWKPALIFLDVMMPKRNGFEVCKDLKSDPTTANVRVVMLTGLSQESHRRKALEVGADDYITKPFGSVELFQKFEDMIGSLGYRVI